MIKPRSLTRETTWIWSQDPALDAPPADAPEAAQEAWALRLKVARDTNQWDGVIKPGEKPTRFSVRIIPGTHWRALLDSFAAGKIGPSSIAAMSVRLALRSVADLTDAEGRAIVVEFADISGFGPCAKQKVVDVLDSYSAGIVLELADFVAERQNQPGPLS